MYDFDGRTVIHHLVENTGLAARQMAKTLLYKAKRLGNSDSFLICLNFKEAKLC